MKLGTAVMAWTIGAGVVAVVSTQALIVWFGIGGWFLQAGLTILAFAALAAPLGALLNKDLERLRASIVREDAGPDEEPSIATSPFLETVSDAVREAVEQARDEADETLATLRELEIRCRISESDRNHLETVLQSLQDAVVVTNPFSELRIANAAAAELMGFDLQSSLNRSIDEVIAERTLRQLLHEAHGAGTPTHRKRIEIDLEAPDSEGSMPVHTYDATLACLPDAKEPIGGVVMILRDISREREISQMKSEFVSKASHELRTPLSSIHAYIEMLLDGEATDEESRTEFHQIIKNEADRLGRLIDNMLNISRIEAGIVKAQYEEVDFVKAATGAIEVIEPQARLKDITVRMQAGPLMYSAQADKDMVHQVMLNLLSNAVKYTPEGGRVTVTVENDETTGAVMTTVADTGLGIPPDALPKVFDKFYRIENYKRVAKGTGLGLSLVKHIVETVHHGHVSVTSELGMGSRFMFTIPYTREGALGVAA